MNLKFDSKKFGTTLFIIYLISIVPLVILLIKTGSDLNKLAMNPGFIIADQIREDYPKLFFIIIFSFLIGSIAISSFIFYIKRNKSSIDFDETIDIEHWKELQVTPIRKKTLIKKTDNNIYKHDIVQIDIALTGLDKHATDDQKTASIIQKLCTAIEAGVGAVYLTNKKEESLHFSSGYAFFKPKDQNHKILFGEGLTGQVAKSQQQIIVNDLHEAQITIFSGLGKSAPKSIVITPIIKDQKTIGVIEIASFKNIKQLEKEFITEVAELLSSEI